MCGIVGVLNRGGLRPPEIPTVDRMIAIVRHRGPEAAGLYIDDEVGLGHARLSIVDLEGGLQPLSSQDESIWLICNGEVFNYVELRAELEARGHRFKTGSDCETIIHLYEERGPDCVHALNGQFAFALWDRRRGKLMLARDRLGIRPLFYTEAGGDLVFGSEIKALLTHPSVNRELDPVALGQVFTGWSALPPRTMFKDIYSLRPGHMLIADRHKSTLRQYWRLEFPDEAAPATLSADQAAAELYDLLADATRLRLRADVPVGAYVSGGLDSSAITAIARRDTTNSLQTFAVAFTDAEFDERPHQERVAQMLGTEHHTITCDSADIASALPDVVWHTETPLLRTSPIPLFLLSGLVRDKGLKVVLTGEGADELLVGYDIFKESKVRAFWAQDPSSNIRPRLLRKLYGHIPEMAQPSQAYLEAFFGEGLTDVSSPDFSHAIRWHNTSRLHRYFQSDVSYAIEDAPAIELRALLSEQRAGWDVVSRAQFNELTTFLDPYLLSSQGDRVAMAHAVEGRFPFLDYRVAEFCNRLPSRMKMPGLREKHLLKQAVVDLLPAEILDRPKQPFRAPIRAAFAGPEAPDYVREVLDPDRVKSDGVFKPEAASWLMKRASSQARFGEVENMALIGMISFGLFRRAFWDELGSRSQVSNPDLIIVADHRTAFRAADSAAA